MLSIAICDDDQRICFQLEQILMDYQKKALQDFKIEVFTSGNSLYLDMRKGNYYDLIFMDIEMDKMNGVETGRRIREELHKETV